MIFTHDTTPYAYSNFGKIPKVFIGSETNEQVENIFERLFIKKVNHY